MCINVLYALVPVLVHVLLDGSGHDSSEIGGTVERHVTSALTKLPVPAPRHSATSSTTVNKNELTLQLDAPSYHRQQEKSKSPKFNITEPSQRPISPDLSTDDLSQRSRIPVKVKETTTSKVVSHRVTQSKISTEIKDPMSLSESRLKNNNGHETCTTFSYSVPLEQTEEVIYSKTVKTTIAPDGIDSEHLQELESASDLTRALADMSINSAKLHDTIESTAYTVKTAKSMINDKMTTSRSKDSRIGEDNASGTIAKETVRSISTKSSWESSTRSRDEQDNWDQAQFSLDTSPGSGEAGFAKNGDSRHDLPSDSDSEGSPRPTRRSLSKRRTLGSSSGSDVALHEGAELSPLEDDQGTSLTANTSK